MLTNDFMFSVSFYKHTGICTFWGLKRRPDLWSSTGRFESHALQTFLKPILKFLVLNPLQIREPKTESSNSPKMSLFSLTQNVSLYKNAFVQTHPKLLCSHSYKTSVFSLTQNVCVQIRQTSMSVFKLTKMYVTVLKLPPKVCFQTQKSFLNSSKKNQFKHKKICVQTRQNVCVLNSGKSL